MRQPTSRRRSRASRLPWALVVVALGSSGELRAKEQRLDLCQAVALANQGIPWTYEVAPGIGCGDPSNWGTPDHTVPVTAWIEDQAAEKGWLVVEQSDRTVIEAMPTGPAWARLGKQCGDKQRRQPAAARVAIDYQGKVRWVDGLDAKAAECLRAALRPKELQLLAREADLGRTTLYRFKLPTELFGVTLGQNWSSRLRHKTGPILSQPEMEEALRAHGVADSCLDEGRVESVRVEVTLDARGVAREVKTRPEVPARVSACLVERLTRVRFDVGEAPEGRQGWYVFRSPHAFAFGGALEGQSRRPREKVAMTACEAAKRATEHTTFGPFVVEGAKSCQASLPFRPGPILVDSAQWLEEQAALHGFLVASGLELTTLKPDSKALRDARQRIRSCTFELQPRWIVEEGVPLLLTIHVDKGGNIVKVSTSWDEIDRRAARCVEQALRSANVPLPSLAPGISTYLLRTSEEAPSDEHPLFTGLR